jgi:hypothetical protein
VTSADRSEGQIWAQPELVLREKLELMLLDVDRKVQVALTKEKCVAQEEVRPRLLEGKIAEEE